MSTSRRIHHPSWQDPFSKKDFTERQRWIGHLNNQRSIYTPEFVVSGTETREGHHIVNHIKQANATPAEVDIQLSVDKTSEGFIVIDVSFDNRSDDSAEVYIALFENNITREIKGGENSGRTLLHNYVVRYWSEPFLLDQGYSKESINLELNKDWNLQSVGIAVVISDSASGHTLQAVSAPILNIEDV